MSQKCTVYYVTTVYGFPRDTTSYGEAVMHIEYPLVNKEASGKIRQQLEEKISRERNLHLHLAITGIVPLAS